MTRHKKKVLNVRSLYIWHRYLGVAAALFVVVLVITGILLNHTEALSLDERQMTSKTMLSWYGINSEPEKIEFCSAAGCASQVGRKTFVNEKSLPFFQDTLKGYVKLPLFHVLADTTHVYLVSDAMELIEKQDVEIFAGKVHTLDVDAEHLVILTSDFGLFISNPEITQWSLIDKGYNYALQDAESNQPVSLSWERVVLDIHSGRFFGQWGVYVMDAAAILMLFLAISGFTIWLGQRKKRSAHRKQRLANDAQ
ncbi:MAG: PepSY domain-containing protein [Gammaproteobacteria bacterium]|nr:PepSY domain-containing protein [Gammaproteobacteria bacterium]